MTNEAISFIAGGSHEVTLQLGTTLTELTELLLHLNNGVQMGSAKAKRLISVNDNRICNNYYVALNLRQRKNCPKNPKDNSHPSFP
jgi:hypothetical protein